MGRSGGPTQSEMRAEVDTFLSRFKWASLPGINLRVATPCYYTSLFTNLLVNKQRAGRTQERSTRAIDIGRNIIAAPCSILVGPSPPPPLDKTMIMCVWLCVLCDEHGENMKVCNHFIMGKEY